MSNKEEKKKKDIIPSQTKEQTKIDPKEEPKDDEVDKTEEPKEEKIDPRIKDMLNRNKKYKLSEKEKQARIYSAMNNIKFVRS